MYLARGGGGWDSHWIGYRGRRRVTFSTKIYEVDCFQDRDIWPRFCKMTEILGLDL